MQKDNYFGKANKGHYQDEVDRNFAVRDSNVILDDPKESEIDAMSNAIERFSDFDKESVAKQSNQITTNREVAETRKNGEGSGSIK